MLKIGDEIKTKKEHKKVFQAASDGILAAQRGLSAMTFQLREGERHLFEIISQAYPETKDFVVSFNHVNFKIKINREKTLKEKEENK